MPPKKEVKTTAAADGQKPVEQPQAKPDSPVKENKAAELKVSYIKELTETLKNMPSSIGEQRQANAAKDGDPLPYSIIPKDGTNVGYIPVGLPDDSTTLVEFTGFFVKLCHEAGFTIDVTKKEVKSTFWGTVKALKDSFEGAYFNLMRTDVAPQDSIPAKFKAGWEFSLWYAYSKCTGDTTGGSYLKIHRVTSLTAVSTTAWGSKESLADLTRLTSSLRQLSESIGKQKVTQLKKFLKGKGYFQQTNCGKKPGAGLYHPEELDIVTEAWTTKFNRIGEIYDNIPNLISAISVPGDKVATIMTRFNIQNPDQVKSIEESRANRIPELLVNAPRQRGREQEKTIAKGTDLPAKLIAMDGGNTIRSIGKVMWSPLCTGMSRNTFTDIAMREARAVVTGGGSSIARRINTLSDMEHPPEELNVLTNAQSFLLAASSCYLEVIPEKRGNPAWDGAFPPPRQ